MSKGSVAFGDTDIRVPPGRFRRRLSRSPRADPRVGAGWTAALVVVVGLLLPGALETPRAYLPTSPFAPIEDAAGPHLLPASHLLPPTDRARAPPSAAGFAPPPSASGAEDWATYLHDPSHSSVNLNESQLTPATAPSLRAVWNFTTNGTGTNRSVVTEPTVAGGTVYFGSMNGYEYALNESTGALRWSVYLGRTVDLNCSPPYVGVSSSATVVGGTLYVGGGDSYWYALNALNGSVKWRVFTGNTSLGYYNWASPLVVGGSAFVGISSLCDSPLIRGAVDEVNLASHLVAHTFYVVPPGRTGGGVWSTPTLDRATNSVYATTGNSLSSPLNLTDAIVQLNASDLALKSAWQIPASQQLVDGDFGAGPTLAYDASGRSIVVATDKNGLAYAWNASNLSLGPRWTTQVGNPGGCPQCGVSSIAPAAFDGVRLYFGSALVTVGLTNYSGSVDAVDPGTGGFLWRHFTPGPVVGAVTATAGLVVVSAGTTLLVLNAANGSVVFQGPLPGSAWSAPSIADGCLFQGTTDGSLSAFGLPGTSCNPPTAPEWVLLPQTLSPPPREDAAMAYAGVLRSILLFGGRGAAGALGDTWGFKLGNWTPVVSAQAPSPRWGSAIAYDPGVGEVMLFGGTDGVQTFGDTWMFNGTWNNLTSSLFVAPSPRFGASLGYDQVAATLVLFGGQNTSGPLGDTWEFSNSRWLPQAPTSAPPARSNATLSRQLSNGSLYLFGGVNGSWGFSDLWRFNAGNWVRTSPSAVPPLRANSTASIDGQVPAVVMFGGNGPRTADRGVFGDTWALNGGEWAPTSPSASPSPRAGAGTAFDARDHYLVLFGGNTAAPGDPPTLVGDTWGYAPVIAGNATANRTTADVGNSIQFTANFAGGYGVVVPSWVFGDGVRAPGKDQPTHSYSAPGTYLVRAWGNDSVGQTLELTLTIVVAPFLNATLTASPKSVDLGQSTHLNETVTGGTPPYRYVYGNLPQGCISQSTPSLVCQPTAVGGGVFFVKANATDSTGSIFFAGVTKLRVVPALQVLAYSLNVTKVDSGVPAQFWLNVTGGAAPFNITYHNLPAGCAYSALGGWNCTPTIPGPGPVVYPISATISDANGAVVVTPTWTLSVYPALSVNLTVSPANVTLNSTNPAPVWWNATVSGGDPPYSGVLRALGLPAPCRSLSSNLSNFSESCNPKITGAFEGNYSVTDQLGVSVRASANLTIVPLTPIPIGGGSPPTKIGPFGGHLYEYLAIGAIAFLVLLEILVLWRQRRKRSSAPSPSPSGATPPER
ncbi:MAG: PQQ-binding-like beta-propeller repeat protein [Thermoplasmata archaeon]|nr:PQQ-binding-like beta-propeller repeat protein [Thermoplasmata archaeon]